MSDITRCQQCGRDFITQGCMVLHVIRDHSPQLLSRGVTGVMQADVASAAAVAQALRQKPALGIVYHVVVVDGKVGLLPMVSQPLLKEE